MVKLTRRHIYALRALSEASSALFARMIPDGNGECGPGKYVSGLTLSELRGFGLIRPLIGDGHEITDAGREALRNSTAAGGHDAA